MLFLLDYYNDQIIINTNNKHCTDEKLFELFYIKNDFAKYFTNCCNLFIQIFCFRHYSNPSK